MTPDKRNPVFLNLWQIRFPVTAVLSIGHRISAVILFFALPVSVYLLEQSLGSAEGYARVAQLLDGRVARWMGVVLIWVFAHHLFSGLRFLLIDIDIGVEYRTASGNAWLVFIAGILALIAAAGWLL